MKRYIIYCDESIKEGHFYSNFYGGALVDEKRFDEVVEELNKIKSEIGLNGELKWTNVSAQTLESYKKFIDKYFEFIKNGIIKIRIMFKQGYYKTVGLTQEQLEKEFYMLYYQFFKKAFGLQYCNDTSEEVRLRIYFDKLPNKNEENERFKDYIYNLQNTNEFFNAHIKISKDDITDINSKNHIILQGMDIILGAMKFRLNEENKIKKPGTNRRGKKTIAKENLYKHINKKIREIYSNFNVGISTGIAGDHRLFWRHAYRHWNFISSSFEIDESRAKNK